MRNEAGEKDFAGVRLSYRREGLIKEDQVEFQLEREVP